LNRSQSDGNRLLPQFAARSQHSHRQVTDPRLAGDELR
jgi:hypothetical protein